MAQVIGKQLLRSGASVGAHYAVATRGRSDAECVSKLQVGLQEIEETRYWIELAIDARIVDLKRVQPLFNEIELTAIPVTMVKKVKARL